MATVRKTGAGAGIIGYASVFCREVAHDTYPWLCVDTRLPRSHLAGTFRRAWHDRIMRHIVAAPHR